MDLCDDPPSSDCPSEANFNIGNVLHAVCGSWLRGGLWGDLPDDVALDDFDL